MLLIFFVAWIIFNGRITVEISLFGLAVAGLMFGFICKFMDYSIEKERALKSVGEHKAILEAIEAHNEIMAEAAMYQHVANAQSHLQSIKAIREE